MHLENKSTAWKIGKITDSIKELLLVKNKKYGNAALAPSKVFSSAEASNSIKIRIDDKINRIKNSKTLSKNDVADLLGYMILLCVSEDWLEFRDLID